MSMNDSVDEYAPINPENQKLDLKTKLAYGAGDLGTAVTGNISIFFLLVFFTNVAGIPAGLAGSILMVGKIWDAINDPIIGVLSDRTKSRRWGRRLPWLVYGAIPFGMIFLLQWIVPRFTTDPTTNIWPLFWYYVAIGLISQIFFTVVGLPYAAMTPELTQDYDERTTLNSFRFGFSIGGSILSLLLAQIIFSTISDREQQYLILAAVCAVISVSGLYVCAFGVRQRVLAFENQHHQGQQPVSIPFSAQLKIVFSNRPYLFVIGIYLCSWLAVQITATTIPYFVVNYMGLKDSDIPTTMIAVQGTALLMLFVWGGLSKKIGRKVVYFLGMSLWILAAGGLFFLQPGQVGLMYFMAVMAGCGVSTAYLIPWSLIPDVIELDELQTGQRREGIFYGFMVLLQKLGLALGIFLVGNALETSGFQAAIPGETTLPIQPDSALLAIRFAVGPLPTIFLISGLFLIYFYPINREIYAQMMMNLQGRREKSNS